jgi:hypothetical protein
MALAACQRFLQINSLTPPAALNGELEKRKLTQHSLETPLRLRTSLPNLNQLPLERARPLMLVVRAVQASRRTPRWGPGSLDFVACAKRYTRKATADLFRAGILYTRHREGIFVNDEKARAFLERFGECA